MSTLDRRVQLLLDPTQYDQLEREASRSGGSVASVIREAIAARLTTGLAARSAAAQRLLRSSETDVLPGDDWESVKSEMKSTLASKLP